MYSKPERAASSRSPSRLVDPGNIGLFLGSVLVVVSLLVPWWSLHSSIVNGQQALFDFTIGPLGIGIGTIVGDPRTLLAGLQAFYVLVTVALLPVSVSLGLGAFNGVYCALRGRRGVRVLIAPLWVIIGLVWWAFYFLVVYSLFSDLGLNIPATGSADVTWQGYQLIGATWGWDVGLWLGIAGAVVLFAGAALSFRGARAAVPTREGTKLAFGFHGIGLLLLALLNLGAMALLLASLRDNGIAWLVLVPVILLFAMAFFARRPKAARAARKPFRVTLPQVPKPTVPSLKLPDHLKMAPDLSRRAHGPPAASPGLAPIGDQTFACPQCGQRFASQVQLNAHTLTHTVSAQAAEARQKMDEFGKRLLGRRGG